MNTNTKRLSILRFGALFLLSGVAFTNVGCSNLTNHESMFFTLKGKDLEVTFCDRGASIYSIKYKDQYMTYHPKDKETFLKNDYYYGKALGRVAGRIKDGDLTVNGKHYQLDINENDQAKGGLKNNNIHGGKDSITTRNWIRSVSETSDKVKVAFTYVSPAMESGFPEEVECKYIYTLHKDTDVLELDIKGMPSGTTPLNLSNHPYFRLGNTGNILKHNLELTGSEYLAKFEMHETKTDQTVAGTISLDSVDPDIRITNYDFRKSHAIGDYIEAAKKEDTTSGGYDHIWKYGSNNCKVELHNPDNGITLSVDSDADAVIMYANCYPHLDDEMNPEGKDALYAGITIEPIKFFTRDNVEALNCDPEHPFTRHISYSFSTEE